MRTRIGTVLAAAAAGALSVATALPAGAQAGPPSLGFEVDKTEGPPGEVVNGQVDVDDVAANCTTDLAAFQARFQELLNIMTATGDGSLMQRFFPTGQFDFENHDQLAFSLTGLVTLGLALDVQGAAQDALPQTFVMTFADIATQEPVGERGSFDASTGQGSVEVPDLDPGLWAVAAACVGPVLDHDLLEQGIRTNGDFLEGLGIPVDLNTPEFTEFVREFLGNPDATALDLLQVIGPDLLQSIVQPDALGFQIFCIHDAEGRCPTDEQPPGGEQPGGEEPGGGEQPSTEAPRPAQPVRATPTFTG